MAGWFLLLYGSYSLLTGVFANDMGGLVRLGYNPDLPLSMSHAPLRFILGLLLNALFVLVGLRTINRGNSS